MSDYNSAYTGKQIDEAVGKVLNGEVGGGGVDVIAQAGQLIRVKEVDAEGRPTKWEAADDMPWVENEADEDFIAFIKSFISESRPKILALLEKYNGKTVVQFKNRDETAEYLKNFQNI